MTDTRLDRMQRMAQRFHATGTVDKLTMRTIDTLAAQTKLEEMGARQIKTSQDSPSIVGSH